MCRELEGLSGREYAEASKRTGINFLSPLHDLQYFKITKCFPQDVMHVLLEGVVPHEFTLFLNHVLEEKYFSLAHLNSKVENFHYNYHERKDKPSPIQREAIQGTKMIGQNACQMWLLSIIFPLLIASHIPEGDRNWACFSIMLKILAISMCRKIQPRMIPILKSLIEDHHERFLVLYPGHMVPKFHFLVHLPDIICRFGPPRSYWCMRFEAKNRFFKDVVHGNFKNIPYTLASEHQLWLCHQLQSSKNKDNFLYKGDEVKGETTVDFRSSALCDSLLCQLHISNSATDPLLALKCNYIKVFGVEYRNGTVIRLASDFLSDPFPFYYGEIIEIYVYNNFKFFICKAFNFECYDTHYNAAIVTPNCVMTPKLVLYDNLYSPGVVSFHYSLDGVIFVVDKDHPHLFL